MERPKGVPDEAFWSAGENEWCLAERDGEGEYHGVVKWWRPDGTLCCVTDYVHGTPHGSFKRVHENGEVSREGAFEEGQLHGTNVFHRSSGATTESFPHGLSEAVTRAEMDYEHGRIVAARCYDAEGRQCMEDGRPFPTTRPRGVPDDAHFRKRESGEYRWVHGAVIDPGDGSVKRTGTWRFWTPEGVLVSEESYDDGQLHGLARTFDEDGKLVEERTHEHGEKKGPFTRKLDDDAREGTRLVWERGTEVDDDVIGVVEYLDSDMRVIASVDTGHADDLEATQSVLTASTDLAALGERLIAERRMGAGVLALARAVGRGEAKPERLSDALRALERPWSRDASVEVTQYTKMVASNIARFGGGPDKCVNQLMEGIRKGGLGFELLRHSSAMLDDMGEAAIALELVDAAIAIAPDDVAASFEYTRALIRASLGDATGARQSVDVLMTAGSPMGPGMKSYISALFPEWTFWPATDGRLAAVDALRPLLERVEARRRIEASAWREAIQKSATRLGRHRARLLEAFGDRPWIVPDVSHLLPEGPVDVPTPESYAGVGVNHLARQEWTRLTWLCWLGGLDEIALPTAFGAPRDAVPVYLCGHARFFLAHGGDPTEHLGQMLAASGDIAEPSRHEDVIASAIDVARASSWFGVRMENVDDLPDADFLREDEQAFMGALAFFTTADHDLFGERDDDEDDDEEDDDDEDEDEDEDDDSDE